MEDVFPILRSEVVDEGLCTHCGTCVGLSEGLLEFEHSRRGPLPTVCSGASFNLPEEALAACPGRGLNYPGLCQFVFGGQPQSWLLGYLRQCFVGHSTDAALRREAASGGVATQVVHYLLGQGLVDGAVVLRQRASRPWEAEPIIAQSPEDLLSSRQSVYVPAPVNTLLGEIGRFEGRLAYVGLPDQVASLRKLQQRGNAAARKVEYVLGLYMGTSMYLESLQCYLRAHGIRDLQEIAQLRYREGEWPGSLYVRSKSGRELRIPKFYYNYLIPFFVTKSSLLSVDFSSELADISLGDAWHPHYESQGGGYSVVVARSERGLNLLQEMRDKGHLSLQEVALQEALKMHAHMIDFKKRGAFLRIEWRRWIGKRVPEYGYAPLSIPASRKAVEVVISGLFFVCGRPLSRRVVQFVPTAVMGPLFNVLRKAWKMLSKPSKRRGLGALEFQIRETASLSKADQPEVSKKQSS